MKKTTKKFVIELLRVKMFRAMGTRTRMDLKRSEYGKIMSAEATKKIQQLSAVMKEIEAVSETEV